MRKAELQRKVVIGIFIVLFFLLVFIFIKSLCGEHFYKNLKGTETTISWDYVNLRDGHTENANIITNLIQNDEVTLTGNKYDILGGDGKSHDVWLEITTKNGITGWIVGDAIDD